MPVLAFAAQWLTINKAQFAFPPSQQQECSMSITKDLFGNQVASTACSPIVPGVLEELDAGKTGGRKMVAIAVPEEYAGLVAGIIADRESAQKNLF